MHSKNGNLLTQLFAYFTIVHRKLPNTVTDTHTVATMETEILAAGQCAESGAGHSGQNQERISTSEPNLTFQCSL